MDKLTRSILASLMQGQQSIAQIQAGCLSMLIKEREITANRVRVACEAGALISQEEDPTKRRQAFDALWLAIDGPERSTAEMADSELARSLAELDRRSDQLAAQTADLIKDLESLPDED